MPSADIGDGGNSVSVEDGWPAEWGRPTRFPSVEPGAVVASPRLPPPTLTDPAEIGLALYDPAAVPVAVVSLAKGLGYGIDGDDGRVILAAPPGTEGRRLPEGVMRSIIEQGVADAEALTTSDTGSFSWTFTDLGNALLPFLPAWDVGRLAAAYDEAYREAPESVAAGVMLGEPIEPSTPLSRVHIWMLLADGFAAPGSTSVAPPGVALAAAPPGTGAANPTLPDLQMIEAAMVYMGLDGMVDVSIRPSGARVHEGHGRPGPSVTLTVEIGPARTHPSLPFPARARPQAPVNATWQADAPDLLTEHGILSSALDRSTLLTNGRTSITYRVRQEPTAAPRSPVVSRQTMLGVRLTADELVNAYFDVPQQYRRFGFWGGRNVEVPIRIAWHGREGIHLTLSNDYDLNLGRNGLVLGSLPISGGATWSGFDTVTGFLAKETDASYRGMLVGTNEVATFSGTFAGHACVLDYEATQWVEVFGRMTRSGRLHLSFLPATPPEFTWETQGCPTGEWLVHPPSDMEPIWPEELGPPEADVGSIPYLPFANARWTAPGLGYEIEMVDASHPSRSYTDDLDDEEAEEAGFGTSVWEVEAEYVGPDGS